MANEQVDWISLDDVMAAADRGLSPLGPELAGFVVLETAHRLRELGGVLDASILAIGTNGHVALTAAPKRGDEDRATVRLRELLSALLALATSSTPALRQCARRRDQVSLALLCRELEGALIPLNRAASRRGLARVARATLEAIESGRLEPMPTPAPREDSEPPPVEVAVRPRSVPPPLPARVEPQQPEPRAETPPPVQVEPDDRTPYCATVIEPTATPPDAIAALAAQLDDDGPNDIEVVSHLPPLVTVRPPTVDEATPSDQQPAFAVSVDVEKRADRVRELIERFEVSRRRDDPALARDLKAMVGIETTAPPPVTVHVKLRPRAQHAQPSEREPSVIVQEELPPRSSSGGKRSGFFALLGLAVIACGAFALAARPSALDAILGPPLPPPGEAPAAANTGAPIAAPRLPVGCEASLALDGVPTGAEVLRRIGVTPMAVTMPMHVSFDLVATMDGHAPRRARVDASAIWQEESTGARLNVPFALDATTDAKWPTASGVVPLRSSGDPARGLLRATSTPNGATIWVVVDPTAITGVPCGNTVELMLVPPSGASTTYKVEWTTFTGSPPRAIAKL